MRSVRFAPPKAGVDPENDMLYSADMGVGKMAGIKLDRATGKGEVVFVVDNATTAFQPTIGPKDKRVLVVTNARKNDPAQPMQQVPIRRVRIAIEPNAPRGPVVASEALKLTLRIDDAAVAIRGSPVAARIADERCQRWLARLGRLGRSPVELCGDHVRHTRHGHYRNATLLLLASATAGHEQYGT